MKKTIKLQKDNVLRLEIETDEGKLTGEYLEFDLEDIELFDRYQSLIDQDKQNRIELRNKLLIIEKQQDFTKKGSFMSNNEKQKYQALKQFFKKEIDVYNLFLGEQGVQKLLNGRALNWSTLDMIDEIIEKQILPYIDIDMKSITDKIKKKYSKSDNELELLDE